MSTAAIFILIAGIAAAGLAIGYALGRRSTTARSVPAPQPSANQQKPILDPQMPKPAAITANKPNGPAPLSAIRSWGYQLQNLDVARVARSTFDLLVIDPTRDGSEAGTLTRAEVERLQRKPDGSRRLVVAYLSIGEAESYRPYWQRTWKRDKPDWLLGENPEWRENYAVCFWDEGWQGLMFGSRNAALDRILAAGFDGVYLDKADVFEDLEHAYKKVARSRKDIAGDMVAFITRLSAYARQQLPGFLVIMQNAEVLLKSRPLLAAIDGVAKEELLFGLDDCEKRNARDEIDEARSALDLAKRAGKAVMVVEYLDDARKIADAVTSIRALGYTAYIAPKNRELDKLNAPAVMEV